MFKKFLLLFFIGMFIDASLVQGETQNCQRTYRMQVYDLQTSEGDAALIKLIKSIGASLEKETGCHITYQNSSVIRALRDMKSHRSDMYAPMTPSDDWDKASVLIPLWKAQRVLLIKKEPNELAQSVPQILSNKKYKIGVLTGLEFFLRPEEMRKLLEEKRAVNGASVGSLANLLKAGRIDGFFVAPTALEAVEEKVGGSVQYELIGDSDFEMKVGIYVSKTRLTSKEINRLSGAVERLKKNGTIRSTFQTIVKPHLLKYYSL